MAAIDLVVFAVMNMAPQANLPNCSGRNDQMTPQALQCQAATLDETSENLLPCLMETCDYREIEMMMRGDLLVAMAYFSTWIVVFVVLVALVFVSSS